MNTQQISADRDTDGSKSGIFPVLNTEHWILNTLFFLFLLLAFAPRAEAVEATNSGGVVTTYTDAGGTNWIYHVFTNAGATGMKLHTLAAGGTVEVLVVAGGGSGGGSQYSGGGGGAGGLIYTNYSVTYNTDYAVSVGPGGVALAGGSTAVGNTGQNSTFGSALTAHGGGGGGNYSSGPGQPGGSGGGGAGNNCGSRTNGGSATAVSPELGNKGGNGYTSGGCGGGGGGGAGAAGVNATSTKAGDGGAGQYVAAFTNWGDTNNLGYFAGGGGGGADNGSPGTGGIGGGGNGSTTTDGTPGQPNTGGGGGGPLSHSTKVSGAGGSGIVIVRYMSLPPVLPASGGDITYPTNLNGRLYGVHIFTNTVGTNYFTTTKDFKVEYLVIGGGGGGGNGRGGGGGAGGYRCSVQGELSGSNSVAEAVYPVSAGVAYPVVVGARGAVGPGNGTGYKGGDSWFTNIVSTGGGGGKERNLGTGNPDGGSGGGGGYAASGPIPGGSGTTNQGFSGGKCGTAGPDGFAYSDGGGGGGAGSAGTQGRDGANNVGYNIDPWGSGGTGLVSSITGVAVGRAGGGGGWNVSWGAATNYGGGVSGASGASSTGGGGGCSGNGGSGVVILRYDMTPPTITVNATSHGFVDVVVNATGTWSYTVSGIALTNNLTVTAPSADFTIATNGGAYGSQVVLSTNADGSVSNTTINVHFIPTNVASFSGYITNASPGAADVMVQVTGNGMNPQPVLYVTPDSLGFGNVITNKTSANFVYTLSGILLQGDVTVTAPSDYFKVSSNGTDFVSSFALSTNASGGLGSTPIYVQFTPLDGAGPYGGSITNSSLNAANKMVSLIGTGVVQTLYVSGGTLAFGNVITNTISAATNYTVWGSNLEANVTVTAPSAEVTVSTNNLTGFGQSCTVLVANASAPSGANLISTPVYVKFTPTALGAYSGNITSSSTGAADQTNAVTGTGVNPPATVSITAPAAKQIFNNGDSVSLTATVVPGTAPYGVTIYTNRFSGGYGVATNATGSSTGFTVSLGALTAGTYHVYATVTDSVSAVVFTSAVSAFIVQPAVQPRMLASGGDVTTIYTNLSSGRRYACHQYTTVGDAAFVPIQNLTVEYLVIGGGGAGSFQRGGGGGAGGYRCSVPGESSGSLSNAEPRYSVSAGIPYPVFVGAGGVGGQMPGADSWFTNIVSTGGGGGRERLAVGNPNGGSGGGGGYTETIPYSATNGGTGTAGQGFKGGNCGYLSLGNQAYGGGGGGAGSAGSNGTPTSAAQVSPYGSGGTGLWSSITGVAVGRAGGGGGNYVTWGDATNFGGGVFVAGRLDGAPSTGGGGSSGSDGSAPAGGNGGSGVVIIRYDITPPKGTMIMIR